jgi:hypothetical protein
MLNTFFYADDIPAQVRARLVDREPLCESAVFETSALAWSRVLDDKNRPLYVLTKRGLVDVELCRLSEDEVMGLPDDRFKERIFQKDVDVQRETEYVVERISEWRQRLIRLFAEVKAWLPSDCQVRETEIEQRTEELMQRYGVRPVRLPTLAIFRGKRRVSLVPSGLWIIGADGRVNVTVNEGQYILVDRRADHRSASDWQIVLGPDRRETVPFTSEIVLQLLGGER